MRKLPAAVCIATLAASILMAAPGKAQQAGERPEQNASEAEGEIRAATQALLDAVAPGEVAVWDKYLDAELLHIDEAGTRRSKKELLAEISPLPPGLVGSIKIDRFVLREFGNWAIADVEMQEQLDYFGQQLRSRFRSLDTWHKTSAGWRLVGQHVSAVLKDPPAQPFPLKADCDYAGVYRLSEKNVATIKCVEGGLTSERSGRPVVNYSLETGDVFFSPGQPRTRRIFLRDDKGRITAFVDRREGEDIRWTRAP